MSVSKSEMDRMIRIAETRKGAIAIGVDPPIKIQNPEQLVVEDTDPNREVVSFATQATIYSILPREKSTSQAHVGVKTGPLPGKIAQNLAVRILGSPDSDKDMTLDEIKKYVIPIDSLTMDFMKDGASITVFPPLSNIRIQT